MTLFEYKLPLVVIVGSGPAMLLSFAFATGKWAKSHVSAVLRVAKAATAGSLLTAICGTIYLAIMASLNHGVVRTSSLPYVYFDVLSAIMLLLVSFLGAVVTRYACRYLEGDAGHGHFITWLCITIGTVQTLVVSGNLLLLAAAWCGASVGLHRLLTFYSHRGAAVVAARKKFVISRVGDACLLGALFLAYRVFGTFDLHPIFVSTEAMRSSGRIAADLSPMCLLFAAAAMLKSAQFPFHSWLPDTMETPTPVSALMHAGIINSGGFLIVRLSPLMSLSPSALDALAMVGGFTAVFASLVMMTQASIKRMLAFSTVAQMGFMMLQCGLGAYSIAVLHILAHSLYKAHAFLTSGSVVAIRRSSWTPTDRPAAHPAIFAATVAVGTVLTYASSSLFGITSSAEPGTYLLTTVFVLSLTYLLWSLWGSSASPKLFGAGSILAAGLCAAYFALHIGFHWLLSSSLSSQALQYVPGRAPLLALLLILFAGMLVLQAQLPQWASRPWLRSLYVHARNGFYFNTLANRIIQWMWPTSADRTNIARAKSDI